MHKKVATVLTKTIAKIRQPTQPTGSCRKQ